MEDLNDLVCNPEDAGPRLWMLGMLDSHQLHAECQLFSISQGFDHEGQGSNQWEALSVELVQDHPLSLVQWLMLSESILVLIPRQWAKKG